ncbi:thiol-disulfide oxidoreductase ResA [Microbulbifer aestuariivivens]|uniref:Thiol-disulfide oxidoreductase ResA n=1 Tax=Microbulbifer aestuariivivens TaxID=1908308 RepID=A0ABP9WP40_9GAMM
MLTFLLMAGVLTTAMGLYQQRDIPRQQLPPLVGELLDGRRIDVAKLAEEGPVLVYFWATWCAYCRLVSPAVADLALSNRVVTVAMQSGDRTTVQQYLSSKDWSFPSINDPAGNLSRAWGIRVTPTIIILNSAGEVAWVTSGTTSKWGLQLRLAFTR